MPKMFDSIDLNPFVTNYSSVMLMSLNKLLLSWDNVIEMIWNFIWIKTDLLRFEAGNFSGSQI